MTDYNYFRDYDPQMGRYVESDPIGLNGGSFSTYACVNGNPIGNVDPLGLASCDGKWVKWGEQILTLPGLGWTLSPGMCFCYWMCKPCRGGIAWSGNVYSLPNTGGVVLVDYSGRNPPNTGSAGIRPMPSGPARGQSGAAGGAYTCLCKKPGEETKGPGCDKCYPDSSFSAAVVRRRFCAAWVSIAMTSLAACEGGVAGGGNADLDLWQHGGQDYEPEVFGAAQAVIHHSGRGAVPVWAEDASPPASWRETAMRSGSMSGLVVFDTAWHCF